MVLIGHQVFWPRSGCRVARCRERDVRLKPAMFGRALCAAAALALLISLGPAFVDPAQAETPPAGASAQAGVEETDESIELRTMGSPPPGRIVFSKCDEPIPDKGPNKSASCVQITPTLLASLRGVTRAQAIDIMGASGHVWQDHLYFIGNYENGYYAREVGDTGDLTLIFEGGKVAEIWAHLRSRSYGYIYNWTHYAGYDETFCSDLPGSDKPCKPRWTG